SHIPYLRAVQRPPAIASHLLSGRPCPVGFGAIVHAILKRQALAAGLKPPNHKRVYRVMKVHDLLLDRHAGGGERRHDGRIAVDERNRRGGSSDRVPWRSCDALNPARAEKGPGPGNTSLLWRVTKN